MSPNILFQAIFCLFYFALFYNSLCFVNATPITSCTHTPYPQVCNYFIGSNTVLQTSKLDANQHPNLFSFRDRSIFVTMKQAVEAHKMILSMNVKSFDPRAKSAWFDCLELYQNTIEYLNRSVSSNNDPLDTQTWLSAAIANQQTCQNGFSDFNLPSHLDSIVSNYMISNFSKLLSNSLAINKGLITYTTKSQNGHRRLLGEHSEFPSWVSASDRKLLQSTGVGPKADLIVAQDGSGNFKTISEGVAASAKRSGGKRFVIYVKKGVYKENVEITRSMKNLMMIGDGMGATIVTGSKNVQDGSTTFRSATFGVSGDGFIAKDMSFENTAGPQKHQAVAFRSGSDFSVFYSCSFKGYQDTLYVYSQRQFYRNCDIHGTQDFIFGDAVVVLQNCNIFLRKPMSNQKNTVTAQGRTDPNENTGIIIHNSRVTSTSDLKSVQGSIKSYLGRPWQKYSRTVFMTSNLDSVIDAAGWLPWSGNFALSTLYYGEYKNSGPGSGTSGRVKWPGYRVITTPTEAGKFTVGNFLAGNSWIPGTGVPFDSGL